MLSGLRSIFELLAKNAELSTPALRSNQHCATQKPIEVEQSASQDDTLLRRGRRKWVSN